MRLKMGWLMVKGDEAGCMACETENGMVDKQHGDSPITRGNIEGYMDYDTEFGVVHGEG